MKSNHYKIFTCHQCGNPAAGAYSDGTAKPDGGFRMRYFCSTHLQAVGRLFKAWEVQNYQNVTNAAGGTYLKARGDIQPFGEYLDQHMPKEPPQTEQQKMMFIT